MNSADSNKPIVVKRVKKYAAGAHGGAWKVAFADFVTAMMALFLVLWLIESTTPAEKMAISMYFTDPTGYVDGGSPFVINMGGGMRNTDAIDRVSSPAPPTQEPDVLPDKNIEPNQSKEQIEQVEQIHQQQENQKFEELKEMLEQRIEADPTLGALRDQIIIKITDDGLMIEVVDKDKRPMFDSGGNVIKPYMRKILQEISKTLLDVPNPLSISGHTDAVPFTEVENYTNWELSADRANAARRAMLKAGIKEKHIARVVGLADSQLYDKDKPENPINRRISILAMRTPVERPTPPPEAKKPEGAEAGAPDAGFPGGVIPGEAAKPAPVIDPNLPPDADFPGNFGAPAKPAPGAVPESIPAVPAGLTPTSVLPVTPKNNGGNATPATSAEPIDPFSTLPGGIPGSESINPKASSATKAPLANGKPSATTSTSKPLTPAKPAPASPGARSATQPAAVPTTPARSGNAAPAPITVPRPSNPDEEFF